MGKKIITVAQVLQYIEEGNRLKKRSLTGLCEICAFPLTMKFPKDFPDEWKFCCSCLSWARMIANKDPIVQLGSLIQSPHIKKICDKITLVKK